MRKGAAGVAQLNAQLQALLNPGAPGRAELPLSGSAAAPVMLRVGDRVIQVPRRAACSGSCARPPWHHALLCGPFPAVDRGSLLPPRSPVPPRCFCGSHGRGPVLYSRRLCLCRRLHSHTSACLVRCKGPAARESACAARAQSTLPTPVYCNRITRHAWFDKGCAHSEPYLPVLRAWAADPRGRGRAPRRRPTITPRTSSTAMRALWPRWTPRRGAWPSSSRR